MPSFIPKAIHIISALSAERMTPNRAENDDRKYSPPTATYYNISANSRSTRSACRRVFKAIQAKRLEIHRDSLSLKDTCHVMI